MDTMCPDQKENSALLSCDEVAYVSLISMFYRYTLSVELETFVWKYH